MQHNIAALPRRFAVLALLILLALVALFYFLLQEEATASVVQYRACDTVVTGPPPEPAIGGIVINSTVTGIEVILLDPVERVKAFISADTGAVTLTPANESIDSRLQAVLATKRVEPLDPKTAPWPYTDDVQVPPKWVGDENGTFRFRLPDPGSGLVVSESVQDGTDFVVHVLRLENCRSWMETQSTFRLGEETRHNVTSDIHPDDDQAFQNFLAGVSYRELEE